MDSEQKEKRIAQIQTNLQARETEDLVQIWEQNDRQEWSDEAFEAIRRILIKRLGTLPPPQATPPVGIASSPLETPPAALVTDDASLISLAQQHLDQAAKYADEDELEAALNECEMAVQIAPHFAVACNDRGLVLAELGKLEEAIADYLEAIRLNPKFYAVRENLRNARIKLDEAKRWSWPVEIEETEAGSDLAALEDDESNTSVSDDVPAETDSE